MKRNIVADNSFIQSSFKITYNGSSASCFQYVHTTGNVGNIFLVTVRHLFSNVQHGSNVNIEIATMSGNLNIAGIIYFPKDFGGQQIDMALIKIQQSLTPVFYAFHREPYAICQEAYFTGFPFQIRLDAAGVNNGYPLPVVKKGIISGYNISHRQFLFDGHNNRGFSGSPIGYHDLNDQRSYLIGVVCAYYTQGNQLNIGGANYSYTENSGIFLAYDFEHALDLLISLQQQNLLDA